MANPKNATVPQDEATLDDVARLMDLQEQVKEIYAEIGRLKKKVKSTVQRRKARNQAELDRLRQAHALASHRADFED